MLVVGFIIRITSHPFVIDVEITVRHRLFQFPVSSFWSLVRAAPASDSIAAQSSSNVGAGKTQLDR